MDHFGITLASFRLKSFACMKKSKQRLEMEHLLSKLVTLHDQYAGLRHNDSILEIKTQIRIQIEELHLELKQFLHDVPSPT